MKKGVLVLGHGSRRQDANEELSKLVGMVQAKLRVRTAHAYFQFAKPSLPDAVDSFVSEGIEEIFIVPALLFPGIHLKEDIPEALDALKLKYGEKVNFHLTRRRVYFEAAIRCTKILYVVTLNKQAAFLINKAACI